MTSMPMLYPSSPFHLKKDEAGGGGDDDVTTTTSIENSSSSSSSSIVQFDIQAVSHPVILPPTTDDNNNNEWQCYYYGNSDNTWNGGRRAYLPTGSVGLAVSDDGLHWNKVAGSLKDGAILTYTTTNDDEDDTSCFDSVHVGVGDVIRVNKKDELHMYYFGGSSESISMGTNAMRANVVGFRMRIGRAKSYDNGRTWVKENKVLVDVDEESEGYFASWPRVVTSDREPWKMFYHTFDGVKWRVFGAESKDMGDTWTRTGLVLDGSDNDNDFDCAGIGTRSVIPWREGLLMIYEGVDKSLPFGRHCFGAAFYDKKDNKWTKLNGGKPILEPGKGPIGDWAKFIIGCPCLVPMPDNSLRLYFCGRTSIKPEDKMAVGMLLSQSGNIEPGSWKAVQPF